MTDRPSGVQRLVGNIVNPVVGAVDLEALLEQVDLDALLERIDVDHLIGRIDLDALLARVDIDAIVQRVDVDSLVGRVDVDGLVSRVDINGIMARTNVAGLVSSRATSGIDLIRRQIHSLDDLLYRLVCRIRRRDPAEAGDGMGGIVAGGVSRFLSYLIDTAVISTSFALTVAITTYLLDLFIKADVEPNAGGFWWALLVSLFALVYMWSAVALTGRTVGKAVLGVRVVTAQGARVGVVAALVRALVYPLSFILGLGLIGVVVGRRRRALHDVAAETIVVHD
jgi:uncharacterized RDD family membrane protein YckC